MINGLKNKRILITRPEKQADNLSKLVLKQGGKPVLFPTIEIRVIDTPDIITSSFSKIEEYDYLVFISCNAVYKSFDQYLDKRSLPKNIKIFAIGKATAMALAEFGIENVSHAADQADSEALLRHVDFSMHHVQNKRILIVRGAGGRELLAECLRDRGAEVHYVEVYQRCLPKYEKNFVIDLWQNVRPDILVVTSGDGLKNLLKLTPEDYRQTLYNTPLVLMSERLSKLAKELGFDSNKEIAVEKNDQGLLSALIKLV